MTIRVAHLVESLGNEFAGLSRAVIDVTSALLHHDIASCIVSFSDKSEYLNTSVPLYTSRRRRALLSFEKLGLWDDPNFLDALIYENGIDILHVHGLWRMQAVYAGRAAARRDIPLVFSTHGMLSSVALKRAGWGKSVFWHVFQRRLLDRCSGIHVTSVDEQRDILDRFPQQKTIYAPLGLTKDALQPRPRLTREKAFLFLGRLTPIKNVHSLIAAWASLKAQGISDQWKLWIAGDGDPEYVRHLEDLARDSESIEFLGAINGERKTEVLSTASCLVLPSYSENFGIVVAEALGYGMPVICSKATPWSSTVRHGCGLWVEGTTHELASAMSYIASLEAAQLSVMSGAARTYAAQFLNLEANTLALAGFYKDLLKTKE